MAVQRVSAKDTLKLKLENGVTETGSTKYRWKSIPNINTELPDDDLFAVATDLADLQTHENAAIAINEYSELAEG